MIGVQAATNQSLQSQYTIRDTENREKSASWGPDLHRLGCVLTGLVDATVRSAMSPVIPCPCTHHAQGLFSLHPHADCSRQAVFQ